MDIMSKVILRVVQQLLAITDIHIFFYPLMDVQDIIANALYTVDGWLNEYEVIFRREKRCNSNGGE